MSNFIPDPDYLKTKTVLKSQKRKYLINTLILICINVLLFTFLIDDGTSTYNRFIIALKACTFSFAAIGFLVGSIAALLPYRELDYRRKYLRSSLLSMYVIQVVMFIGVVLAGLASLKNNNQSENNDDSLRRLESIRKQMEIQSDSVFSVMDEIISLNKESKLSDEKFELLKLKSSQIYYRISDRLENVSKDFQGKISPEEYNDFVKKFDKSLQRVREKKKELKDLGLDFKFKK